jgi:hypothetical protein
VDLHIREAATGDLECVLSIYQDPEVTTLGIKTVQSAPEIYEKMQRYPYSYVRAGRSLTI